MDLKDWFLAFIAIFVPPVAVALKCGLLSKDLLVNFLLFFFGFFPGLIHALWVISKHPRLKETIMTDETTINSNTNYGSI
ncbi:hypothetical protein Kpol_2000p106 [Vanderwaltozyma polyspora DSM 70294]|uniref:Plasma membrane proteolipid 3 n=1 Tax=Vanderwaltozyma polyspora (strain ATCC 22028 / DSM 70294 / BCRC 21397 / CBS 2163 / NBRC 10782 / NRRL Y-8283 / UCD 57-17) TaxID=436907 RepID=A7TFB3_VANPO|nr:uncharacterized protein Kpol_2000p106 [Vanderwaltozyma polyspora DSM 70294]EDO19138.1 hypothetical protein Kpol_2000p106 [Vanderwaltozyma polyspora DSM 70294]